MKRWLLGFLLVLVAFDVVIEGTQCAAAQDRVAANAEFFRPCGTQVEDRTVLVTKDIGPLQRPYDPEVNIFIGNIVMLPTHIHVGPNQQSAAFATGRDGSASNGEVLRFSYLRLGGLLRHKYKLLGAYGGTQPDVAGRRVPIIFDAWATDHPVSFNGEVGSFTGEVSADLGLPDFPCGLGSCPSFINRITRSISSPFSMYEGPVHQPNAGGGNEHFQSGHTEQPWGPIRYFLLGLGVALVCAGWLAIICGFKRAGDAMDVVLDGDRRAWLLVAFWFGFAISGGATASGIVTYALSLYLGS